MTIIPRLWASRKIAALSQQLRLEGRDPRVIEEIRELALRYGLLSEYTSYLVQEPEARVALDRVAATGTAAAPAANVGQAGQGAVQLAARERQSRDVRSSVELEKAQMVLADSAVGIKAERRNDAGARQAAGRQFRQQGPVWMDDSHKKSQRVQTVEQFSSAYFALLRQLPELEIVLEGVRPGAGVRQTGEHPGQRRWCAAAERGRAESRWSTDFREPLNGPFVSVDWADVYRGLYQDVVRFLYRKVWDADRAQDLAQETFVRCLPRTPTTRARSSSPSQPTWRAMKRVPCCGARNISP